MQKQNHVPKIGKECQAKHRNNNYNIVCIIPYRLNGDGADGGAALVEPAEEQRNAHRAAKCFQNISPNILSQDKVKRLVRRRQLWLEAERIV